MSWTPEQEAAIHAENDTILVSAAAGSGKTAVLVERVIALLRKGASLDRMLIVTFTRAAAAEMRERIEAALSASPEEALQRQAGRVGRAQISTLHAFCQRYLRDHFSRAGVDPHFSIATEADLAPMWETSLQETLDEAWEHPTPAEKALFGQFEYEECFAVLPGLHAALLAHEDPFRWAGDKLAEDPGAFFGELERAFALRIRAAGGYLDEMERLLALPGAPIRYADALQSDRELCDQLLSAKDLCGLVPSFRSLGRKAPPEEDPEITARYRALRDDFKEAVRKAAALFPASREEMEKAHALSREPLEGLIGLCEKADRAFREKKQRRNRLDFTDLEHLMLKVLSDPAARLQAGMAFDHLFVDEYQDVSAIQEKIIVSLHRTGKNCLFLVGDVKQSIYRFRSADPTLFMARFASSSAAADAPCRKILLNANFRSTPALLSGINLVFRHAMRRDVTEIEYDDEAALRPGTASEGGDPIRLLLFRSPEGEEEAPSPPADGEEEEDIGESPSAWIRESWWIAGEIRRLLDEKTLLVPGPDGPRPVRCRDIVILLRYAHDRSQAIAGILGKKGIPVYSDADSRYFDLPEVRDMMTLLKCLVNPLSDVELLGALASPCFGFTNEELALVRLSDPDRKAPFHRVFLALTGEDSPLGNKCRAVTETLDRWRFLARNMPLDSFLWVLAEESGLYLRAGASASPESARARLRLFAEQAQGENARLSLQAFTDRLESARKTGDSTTARTLSDNDDVVRIMTLHKSKGLQFPVAFRMGTARRFRAAAAQAVLVDDVLGPACRILTEESRVVLPNPALTAIREKNRLKQKAEEARLMYVGMTRARQRLYFLGSPRDPDKAVKGRSASPAAAVSASSMLDFVLDALGEDALKEGEAVMPGGERFLIAFPPALSPARDPEAPGRHVPSPDPLPETVPLPFAREEAKRPPLKTSVTALVRHLREEDSQTETAAVKRTEFREAPPERPRFLMEEEDLNGSERGTLIHRCLGALDLDACRRGDLDGALDRLAQRGLFSQKEIRFLQEKSVRERILGFYSSPVGQRMLRSPRVQREWAFDLHLHTSMAEYLQGVIDLCFLEDGQWVLCDYKTDRLDAPALAARYREQLGLYRMALEKITGLKVRETVLYSLHLGTQIPLFPEQG